MADWDIETIAALHESSNIEDIQVWLETCEEYVEGRIPTTKIAATQWQWRGLFLDSVRKQLVEGARIGKEKPLSPKTLARLKAFFDKIDSEATDE
jgi:hypothetical protein